MSQFTLLEKELRTYLPDDQIQQIHQAYRFAEQSHQSQNRFSGEQFIIHPVAVATILTRMHLDAQSIIAALLHDVIEDTHVSKAELEKRFGKEVTKLVDGVSKLTQIKFESYIEAQAENFRKMIMAMVDDIRVILIKLADRLHNMRTLQHLPIEKRKRIAKETLEIYSPIANRLGMHVFRVELEDLGFSIYHPMRYRILKEAVEQARGNRKEIISIIQKSLNKTLKDAKFGSFKLMGREKHLYGIYKKMEEYKLKFTEVMDIYAFRIIVQDRDDCYRVLGLIHNLYKPIPRRFKDYIAIPKANGYQSLHTILFGPYGVPIEIQIRTEEMSKIAENGIAAHWIYKMDENIVNQAQMHAKEWIRGLMEIQQSAGDSLEFVEHVKIDLFPDEVYVFTPQGEIMELPAGATPIDFAYKVHSDVGNACVAAKINRRLASLSTQLHNGQTVEVITNPTACPNPSWLNFVVTGKARGKIRHFLKHQRHIESTQLGRRLLDNALSFYSVTREEISEKEMKPLLKSYRMKQMDDLLEAIGLGNQMAPIVARRLMDQEAFKLKIKKRRKREPLRIKGSEGVVVTFAKCCYPIPGDPIEGILTAGQGLVVHHHACKSLVEYRHQPDKCISLSWEENVTGEFLTELHIDIVNLRGVLADIALTIADEEANIENVNIEEKDKKNSLVTLIIHVKNRAHLLRVIKRIRKLKHVTRVIRYQNI